MMTKAVANEILTRAKQGDATVSVYLITLALIVTGDIACRPMK